MNLRPRPNRQINILRNTLNKLSECKIVMDNFDNIETIDNVMEDLGNKYTNLKEIQDNKEPHKKAADIGMATLWNEEECIRGWAKTMLYFCNEVYALIDPTTTDNTEKILRKEFPTIKILKQDRSLGDSDNLVEGKNKALIMHANYNHFINELVDDGEIFFLLSADERFYTPQFPLIESEIQFMRDHGAWNSWHIPQKTMYQFYPDDFWVLDFSHAILKQAKFFRKVVDYNHNLPPHSGWNFKEFTPSIESKASWFHYCFLKMSRPAFGYWRDVKRFKDYKKINFNNPMPYWRNLPELNNKGELIV